MARKPRQARKDDIKVVGFLLQEDGSAVPMEELTEVQRAEWLQRCSERLSKRMSEYYTQHPEEYIALCRSLEEKERRQKQERESGLPHQ